MNRSLDQVSAYLRAQGVPFAVIGATAMAVHGVSRATQDVDLLTTSVLCLREEFWGRLRASGMNGGCQRGATRAR
jgi:predicted nucleotidyltransferase